LQHSLNDKAERQSRLLSGKHTGQEAAAAAQEIDAITAEYHEVEAQMRTSSPRYAALTQPQPLRLEEVQKRVLDPDSLLLEYSLGEEASSLFAVSQSSIQVYPLPKRAEIEALAGQAYEAFTARNRFKPGESAQQRNVRILQADVEYPRLAARLSQLVLAPAAAQLGAKRLLIVADGALLEIPFAALLDPAASSPQPLVMAHEIVSLPSASVIAVQRHEWSNRKSAAKQLALFADPVFEPDDERVAVAAHLQDAKAKVTMASNKPPRDAGIERSDFEQRLEKWESLARGLKSSVYRSRGKRRLRFSL
jgi:CHAT domain-containing protein